MGKRIFDMCFAIILLVLTSPMVPIIALLILVASGRPIIYRQDRIGLHGRKFTIYKFRTMIHGADTQQDRVVEDDNRITYFGNILRQTHFDELPQLFNVLRGDMSVVGPRPRPVWESNNYLDTIPRYEWRFIIPPGLTGPAQVLGRRWMQEVGPKKVFQLELTYIRRHRFCWDILILLQGLLAILRRQGM